MNPTPASEQKGLGGGGEGEWGGGGVEKWGGVTSPSRLSTREAENKILFETSLLAPPASLLTLLLLLFLHLLFMKFLFPVVVDVIVDVDDVAVDNLS